MKTRWAILLAAIVVCCSLSAFAGPTIIIGDPSCNTWNSNLGPLISVTSSNTFSVTSNQLGGGYFGICNNTGTIWNFVDMKFLTTTIQPGDIDCSTSVFGACTVTAFNGGIDLLFSTPPNTNCQGDSCGIPKDQLMTVDLNTGGCIPKNPGDCSNNDGDWPSGLTFYAGTNQDAVIPTPEPTTFAMLGVGLLGVWQYRRRR